MAAACLLAAQCVGTAAHADEAADRAAITGRLLRWTAAFNARDAAGVCDLFAPDLVSIVPGAIDGSRTSLCGKLGALLARPDLQLHYANPEIREIRVIGDVAIVRPIWTLTVRKGTQQEVTKEAGIDIFQRQPDGKWSISRFASFSDTPNKILE